MFLADLGIGGKGIKCFFKKTKKIEQTEKNNEGRDA